MKHSLLVVAALLLCGVTLATAAKRVPWADEYISAEEKKRVCNALDASFMPFSCTPDYVEHPGDAFVRKHNFKVGAEPLNPVILVPGLMGSALEAKLDREDVPAWYCWKKWDWYGLWLSLYEILAQSCAFNNLEVNFHPENYTYANQTGVQIRPRDFGGLQGVRFLDDFLDDPLHLTGIYETMIEALETIGYVERENLFGAPYDWRLPVDFMYENTNWGQDIENLIEFAYTNNGNRSVHIITHSMGGPTMLYLFNRRDQAWRDKYIASFTPLAGPWSGSVKALQAIISGTDEGIRVGSFSILQPNLIANVARQSGGVAYLMPDPTFWNQTFVSTPTKNYTDLDFTALFTDSGLTETLQMYDDVRYIIPEQTAPFAQVYCLYGVGVETSIELMYDKSLLPGTNWGQPSLDTSDLGDGTVPLMSLAECKHWDTQQSQLVNCREFNLTSHGQVLKDPTVVEAVLEIVTNQSPIIGCEQTPLFNKHYGGRTFKHSQRPANQPRRARVQKA
jgi:lysophospholipase-3